MVPLNPTLVAAVVLLAVTVTTKVVTTTTVDILFALVVAAGAGVVRRAEEVRSAVPDPVATAGEVLETTEELAKALEEEPKP
jgi:hypothetical protein